MIQDMELIEKILAEKSGEPQPVHLLKDLAFRYSEYLKEHRFPDGIKKLSEMEPDEITKFLKREKFDIGKYKQITVFEAANRIASDLVLLEGLPLIAKKFKATKFKILLGNYHDPDRGDFSLEIGGKWFEGEAFSTAESYFHPKLSGTVNKWNGKEGDLRFILFNSSAHPKPENSSRDEWGFCLRGEKVMVWENPNAKGHS